MEYTPEDYALATWKGAAGELVEPADVPVPEPHPNEIATRQAVEDGIYAPEDVGVPVDEAVSDTKV